MTPRCRKGRVEKITNGGWGLVRSDEGVVFVNYVLPGEQVTYRIKEKARGVLWGRLLEVLTASEYRVDAPCPYFGECGGCVFQHIDYQQQKAIKRNILRDDLERIGHYKTPLPGVIPSPPFHNRIRARMKGQDDGKIGFIRKGTNTVIPINRCLLFPEAVNRFLAKWNSLENPPFFHQLDILMNPDNKSLYIHLSHPPDARQKIILEMFPGIVFCWEGNEETGVSRLKIKEWSYLVSPGAFFQVNPFQWENMLNGAESYLGLGGGDSQTIIDLYTGVGFFIPLLKQYCRKVIGVESFAFSVALAKRAFGGTGVDFLRTPVEKFHFPEADIILLDPPRSGLSKYVLQQVLRKKYKKILYVSCSSATFSRDLKGLRESGYRLGGLKIFDLFPQTAHLETIACFVGD